MGMADTEGVRLFLRDHMDIHRALTEFALLQDHASKRIEELRIELDKIERSIIPQTLPIRQEIENLNHEVTAVEKELRQMLLDYVQETGDLKPHRCVEFRRKTKLMYDKSGVIGALMAAGDFRFIKADLHVREFEKAFRANEVAIPLDVEAVNAPEIAISGLGELVIEAEAKDDE